MTEADVGYLLRSALKRHDGLMQESGLTAPQYRVLAALKGQRGPVRMWDLLDTDTSDRASFYEMAARMEKAGLITRRDSEEDRRVKLVTITRAGTRAFERGQKIATAAGLKLLAKVPVPERPAFVFHLQGIATP